MANACPTAGPALYLTPPQTHNNAADTMDALVLPRERTPHSPVSSLHYSDLLPAGAGLLRRATRLRFLASPCVETALPCCFRRCQGVHEVGPPPNGVAAGLVS